MCSLAETDRHARRRAAVRVGDSPLVLIRAGNQQARSPPEVVVKGGTSLK